MKIILNLVYILVLIIISPIIVYRIIFQNRYRVGVKNRFGSIIRKNPNAKCIWIHAVSLGEINAARTIINELNRTYPDYEIVISTTTDTGLERAKSLYHDKHNIILFPLDLSWVMKKAFDSIRPNLCLLMELEIWPNFTSIANSRNIPVVIVNGRLSERSFSRYSLIKSLVKKMYGSISLVLAQNSEYANRFIQLGCPAEKVIITGSLKYDTAQIADKVEGSDELLSQLKLSNRQLWVAGATGIGEEELILEVHKNLKNKFKNLCLAVVPRKPERFDEVADTINKFGFSLIRYSDIKSKKTECQNSQYDIILGDTMGDLRKFYSISDVIFVGRSLVKMGGSDMIEACALGKCTMFGPYAFNFRQTVDKLTAGNGAIEVQDKKQLEETLERCLTDTEFAQRIGRNGQNIIRNNQGATNKSLAEIEKFL